MTLTPAQRDIVRQEDPLGCAIACAAMIAGCTYQEARDAIAPGWDGKLAPGCFAVQEFLKARGWEIVSRYEHFYPARQSEETDFAWPPAPFAEIHLVSLAAGHEFYGHSVVMFADGTVLDPNKSQPCRLSDYPHVNQIRGVYELTPLGHTI